MLKMISDESAAGEAHFLAFDKTTEAFIYLLSFECMVLNSNRSEPLIVMIMTAQMMPAGQRFFNRHFRSLAM